MKVKCRFISEAEFQKWIQISNLFAKSLIPPREALKQFNSLDSSQKNSVKRKFASYDDVRRKKIPKGESDSAWETSVMVDAHIIATEFDVDPLTVVMCVATHYKLNECVYVR